VPEHRKKLYPKNWAEIRAAALARASYRCEGTLRYPNCRAAQGEPHPVTGKKVALQVHHRNHRPSDCRTANLVTLCGRCHLETDRVIHERNRRQKVFAASREGESLALPLEG
jgi:5-methylcytosine-specific restriction endonuclease McrA